MSQNPLSWNTFTELVNEKEHNVALIDTQPRTNRTHDNSVV